MTTSMKAQLRKNGRPVKSKHAPKRKRDKTPRVADFSFEWLETNHPDLLAWREPFTEWISLFDRGRQPRMDALNRFIEYYLSKLSPTASPEVFLSRGHRWPDFYEFACVDTQAGTVPNNRLSEFLDWLLESKFSEPDDHGRPVVLPQFVNPVARRSKGNAVPRTESVRSPLPYRFILELREMLAPGRNFRDWIYAHNEKSVPIGLQGGARGPDWLPVHESAIDESDPDCVFRRRRQPLRDRKTPPFDPSKVVTVYNEKRQTYEQFEDRVEVWCPVRAVAILIKLLLPLRTYQVRMLDSGEGDTWKYTEAGWIENPHSLASGSAARPTTQGVLRRHADLETGKEITTLYINSNKTADIGKDTDELGYEIPWQNEEVIYWLSKLRRWQEKYNPIQRKMKWSELEARHFSGDMKSPAVLARMPDACFLFRAAEDGPEDDGNQKPIRDIQLSRLWYHLLNELQARIAARGEAFSELAPIRLVPPWEQSSQGQTTHYPLHSLRVSLLTSLAIDGGVPLPILSKMVAGHARLVMTLYYLKMGYVQMNETLKEASDRMATSSDVGMRRFLAEAKYKELDDKLVRNNKDALAAAVPVNPSDRNPLGWVGRSYGMCLVGGSVPAIDAKRVPGCHNGGPAIRIHKFDASLNEYAPVSGGPGNCIRCRWFATEPRYLDALRAHFNNVSFRLSESASRARKLEEQTSVLKAQRYAAERGGVAFVSQNELLRVEAQYESEITKTDGLANDWLETFKLIKRCVALANNGEAANGESGNQQLVAVGGAAEVRIALESASSELFELAGICSDAEVYPDENPGKAVLRRSQLLDSALYREGLTPLFMGLSEDEQLLVGNRFIESLARTANPSNLRLGTRQVVSMVEAGSSLCEQLGLDLEEVLTSELVKQRIPVSRVRRIEHRVERTQ